MEAKASPRRLRSLVTGGAGFLGSHLCDRLLAEGHEVICVDNLLTASLDNTRHLLGHPRFLFIQHDVIQQTSFPDLFTKVRDTDGPAVGRTSRLDYLLHFASPASPKDYGRHPIPTLKVGAIGTANTLELARTTGAVFLLASSSEVYGDPTVSPQSEIYWGNVNPIGPRSVYDEAKRFAEAITMAYSRAWGVKARIARIFNTYGERMRLDDGRVLPNFFMQALQGKPLTVYGDGSQTRSLCYVSDLVEGLYRLLLSDHGGPINLGSPEEVTVQQLAREVMEATGSRSTITHQALPEDDPKRRRPDISQAIALLDWQPKVRRSEGLRRVVPYFQAQVEALCAR